MREMRTVCLWLLLPLVALLLVWGLGVSERTSNPGCGLLEEWLVGGPEKPDRAIFDVAIQIDGQGRRPLATVNSSESIPLAWADGEGPMAKTQVIDSFGASCTVRIYASSTEVYVHRIWLGVGTPNGINVSWLTRDYFGGVLCDRYRVNFWAEEDEIGVGGYLDVPVDDDWHEYDAYVSFDGQVQLTVSEEPIGSPDKAAVTHAKEWTAAETWSIPAGTTIRMGFGPVTVTSPSKGSWAANNLGLMLTTRLHGTREADVLELFEFTDIVYTECEIDAGLLDKYVDPDWTGSSWTGEKLHITGDGNTITYGFDAVANSSLFDSTEIVAPPHMYSFSGLHVYRMGTTSDLTNLEVWFGGAQVYNAATGSWQYVKHTVAEWQNTTLIPSYGIYSWDNPTPPDGALKTLSDAYFWIDRDSARQHRLEGFQVEAVNYHSFDDDSCIVINGWPLDATDRQSAPYFTDVVTFAHRNNVGVYGPSPALSHEDWVPGSGATAPDGNGDFLVTSLDDATLTLTLPSNYEDRLSKVRNFTAPEGVPMAYMTRKADWYLADGEDPEAVYCWLGWRYLRILFDVPVDCDVTVDITYEDFGTHTDNHYTDSSRQTEYRYTPGSTYILSRTKPVEAGNNRPVLIDLATSNPLVIVKSIKVTLGAVGEWSIGEPELVLDPGDDLPGTENDRDAVEPHWAYKWFEHYKYREGGVSAVVDGQQCGIEWPDHYKSNTLERWLGGNFDYRVGKTSGIDFTAAWPLGTFCSNVNRCCDAWNVTYNQSAAETHTVDADGTVLKTLSVTDLVPCDARVAESTAPYVAIRVAKWSCVPGLLYDWHAIKLVMGVGHGWAGSLSEPARGGEGKLYRRDDTETLPWTEVENILANQHGYWRSIGHEVIFSYDGGPYGGEGVIYYKYATRDNGVPLLGHFAVREWVAGLLYVGITPPIEEYRSLDHLIDLWGRMQVYYTLDDGLGIVRRVYNIERTGYTESQPISNDDGAKSVCCLRGPDGVIWVAFCTETGAYVARSTDEGEVFSVPVQVLSGEYTAVEAEALPNGSLLVLLNDSDGAWFVARLDYDPQAGQYSLAAGPTALGISGLVTRGSLRRHPDGQVYFHYIDTSGNVVYTYSLDRGGTWA